MYSAFEVDPSTLIARFNEGLQVMKTLWSESDVTFNGRYIVPVNNSNWPQLNDPTINKAIENCVNVNGDARAPCWGKVDAQISALAPAIPWVWDNEGYVRSKDVNGVVNLFNAEWDLSFSSVTGS